MCSAASTSYYSEVGFSFYIQKLNRYQIIIGNELLYYEGTLVMCLLLLSAPSNQTTFCSYSCSMVRVMAKHAEEMHLKVPFEENDVEIKKSLA